MPGEIIIRRALQADVDAIWQIIKSVINTGDTYTFLPDSGKDAMLAHWFSTDKYTYVALVEEKVAGTFIIKDNQPGLGSHIANASYMVSSDFKGQGVGSKMGEYSLDEAKKLGYHAMQFNIVVKTNEVAVNLWKKLGFDIIGQIPEAFQHQKLGLIDAYIMYRKL